MHFVKKENLRVNIRNLSVGILFMLNVVLVGSVIVTTCEPATPPHLFFVVVVGQLIKSGPKSYVNFSTKKQQQQQQYCF